MAILAIRRYLFIAVSITLTLYFSVSLQPIHLLFGIQGVAHPGTARSAPLLGSHIDAAPLWMPDLSIDADLRVPAHNIHHADELRPRTPLFIGFTRSQDLVEQAVLSYIAAGWPKDDIILVDNSGTLDANSHGLLSTTNPFYLNYTLFRQFYGVSILQTPTLLSFSQLMNFYLRTAIAQNWSYFFWTHQDVAVLGDEAVAAPQYLSFHQRVLQVLATIGIRNDKDLFIAREAAKGGWAVKFFAYDWLTLVNVAAWRVIGQWDNFIPYYAADCDAYSRLALHGFTKDNVEAGHVFDVSEAMPDLTWKLFERDAGEGLNSERYQRTKAELGILMSKKWRARETLRNSWQASNVGGRGEPFTYDPDAFQQMWWAVADHGRLVYKEKWGTDECKLEKLGLTLDNMFQRS